MILVDLNLLIHAHNSDSKCHESARHWWDGVLCGSEGTGLAWVVILGFVRITTHPGILESPFTPDEACERLDSWLSLPQVHIPMPAPGHFARLREHLSRMGTGGNLTTDAHLATLAIERGYTLYSTDADFGRFRGLRWLNPVAGKA